jgi:hypothetical protein
MAKSKFKSKVRSLSAEESKAAYDKLDKAVKEFKGELPVLEQALGMYVIGRHIGWRPLVLVHNKRTIKKYEEILGIDIRTEFPEVGPDAERSLGYRFAQQLSNFWKAVSGDVQVEGRSEIA